MFLRLKTLKRTVFGLKVKVQRGLRVEPAWWAAKKKKKVHGISKPTTSPSDTVTLIYHEYGNLSNMFLLSCWSLIYSSGEINTKMHQCDQGRKERLLLKSMLSLSALYVRVKDMCVRCARKVCSEFNLKQVQSGVQTQHTPREAVFSTRFCEAMVGGSRSENYGHFPIKWMLSLLLQRNK